jgi:hypothetical protein
MAGGGHLCKGPAHGGGGPDTRHKAYKFHIRALGGSTGYTDWSPVTGRMSL